MIFRSTTDKILDISVIEESLPRDILCIRVWPPAPPSTALRCPVQQFREAECGSAEADLSAAPSTPSRP